MVHVIYIVYEPCFDLTSAAPAAFGRAEWQRHLGKDLQSVTRKRVEKTEEKAHEDFYPSGKQRRSSHSEFLSGLTMAGTFSNMLTPTYCLIGRETQCVVY